MENKIEFRTQTNQIQDSWVMRITADRKIEVNEDVDVTFAAQKVLDAMQGLLTPQRTWVGLNDEQMRKICGSVASMREAVREAEAILKEGNT